MAWVHRPLNAPQELFGSPTYFSKLVCVGGMKIGREEGNRVRARRGKHGSPKRVFSRVLELYQGKTWLPLQTYLLFPLPSSLRHWAPRLFPPLTLPSSFHPDLLLGRFVARFSELMGNTSVKGADKLPDPLQEKRKRLYDPPAEKSTSFTHQCFKLTTF